MDFELTFYLIDYWLIGLAMLVGLLVASEIGYRTGSLKEETPESYRSLMSGIGAAMLGLLGLLLGFTLAMAIGRWDARRDVIVNESNAISTLWLRAGFLEESDRNELRKSLREYTEARIALGENRDDLDTWRDARMQSEKLHSEIWLAVERVDRSGLNPAILASLISAANDLIDIHETRLASIENFLPVSLLLLLLSVAATALGFLAWSFGAADHRGGRIAILMLGLLISAVLLLIMDVNRPQRGVIGVGIAPLERLQDTISETQES